MAKRIKTERSSFFAWLGQRAEARILIEASTESEWVARYLEELNQEVIVADPNFAPIYATRGKKVKAVAALARKLAGILFAIWRDGTKFDPQCLTRELPATA